MLQKIIELLRGDAFRQALIHQEQVRESHRSYLLRNATGFAREMAGRNGKTIVIAEHRASGRSVPVRLSLHDLFAHHLIQGRSGSGKSRYAELLILPTLKDFPEVGMTLVDGKGESFERVRLWIAALIYQMPEKERERFLKRVFIVDPFHASVLPSLNFCISTSHYPAELLAEDILGGLRRLFAEDGISVRMEVLLRNILIALIEAGREGPPLSLLEARDLLADEAFRERVLVRVKNEEARAYFVHDFPREARGTIEAVKSRLSYLLLSEQVRLSFGAANCVQFREAIEHGNIILINLGKTLLATDKAREVVGTLVLSSFARSIFSRPMNQGPFMLTFMDEFQNFVIADVLERLYTEARAYRCFVTAICQQMAAQISSRALRDIILNNVRYITLFSSNEEEARLLGRMMFRPTGCLPKPGRFLSEQRGTRFYSEAEELEMYIRRVPSLKHRHCFFWDKESPFGAQPLVTRTVSEPHEYAGVSQEEFLRFYEHLEPLWRRMGTKKEEAKEVVDGRRRSWGIRENASIGAPRTPPLNRRSVLEKLEAHFGNGKKTDV